MHTVGWSLVGGVGVRGCWYSARQWVRAFLLRAYVAEPTSACRRTEKQNRTSSASASAGQVCYDATADIHSRCD